MSIFRYMLPHNFSTNLAVANIYFIKKIPMTFLDRNTKIMKWAGFLEMKRKL